MSTEGIVVREDELHLYKAFKMQMLNDPQNFVVEWRTATFGGAGHLSTRENILAQLGRARKEIDELVEAIQALEQGDTPYLRRCVKKEMTDVLVTLFSGAEALGFNLMKATRDTVWTLMHREWKSNGDGTGQHTKKAPWELES